MRLIDEQFFALHSEIRERMATLSVRAGTLPAPFERAAQGAARAYLLLTEFPDQVLKHGYSAEEVFWSRWYWIQRCVKLHSAFGHCEAGLEQQAFKVLESYEYHQFEAPDWESRAEALDARVARDVEEFIAREGGRPVGGSPLRRS
jgi:hypothetical protein